MAGQVIIAVIVVAFVAGAVAGAILLVSLASRREDRRRLDRKAPDRIASAGRLVTGLRVEDPGDWGRRHREPRQLEPSSARSVRRARWQEEDPGF